MHNEMREIRCSIVRGGTSKGVFFLENDLPKEKNLRDRVIQAAFGGVDERQIDGLGGADPLTSKVAIIGPSTREGCDVDYTFGQVSFTTELVDYKGNCGNISAAVGPFAIDAGLVKAVEPITKVKIHLTNTDNIIVSEVPVENGKAKVCGNFEIDGVMGTGSKIKLDFSDMQGAQTGKLLPTGNAKDIFDFGEKGRYEVSLVDAGNPLVFITAASLGMNGTETPNEIEADKELMDKIELIRSRAALKFKLVKNEEEASVKSPYIPFFAIVSPVKDYICYNGKQVNKEDIDIVSRLLFMHSVHKAYPGTGTVCTGCASRIPGTVVWEQLPEEIKKKNVLNIGHPSGIIPVETEYEITEDGKVKIKKAAFYRTARKIMDGVVYIKNEVFEKRD